MVSVALGSYAGGKTESAYITFDIIYRYLKRLGYDVVYVRNFTDIDDKIIKRANEENATVSSISEKYIGEYLYFLPETSCS